MDEALDSVLSQDFEDFELLLVDDGSSDSSSSIARAKAAQLPDKVRYLQHDEHEHRGCSSSRNLGLAHAAGTLVAFVDADDRWKPGKLRDQVSLMDTNHAIGMLCGSVNYWRSWEGGRDRVIATGHSLDRPVLPPEAALSVYPLGMHHAACPSDIIVRRSAAKQVGGFEDEFTGAYEDLAFYTKMYLHSQVWFSSAVWTDYRIHAGSLSSGMSRADYRAVRNQFLNWCSNYLKQTSVAGKDRLTRAVRRARWEMDHPIVGLLARRLRVLMRRSAAR